MNKGRSFWRVIIFTESGKMEPTRIGSRLFVDGVTRDVFIDADGRQFALDHEGKPVYGIWIYIPDPDPEIVTK